MSTKTSLLPGVFAFAVIMSGLTNHGQAQVVTTTERLGDTGNFQFSTIPDPSSTDLLEGLSPILQDGLKHSASGPNTVLTDGLLPSNNGDTANNFFFSDSGGGPTVNNGRLLYDLGSVDAITQINSYSWHSDTRAPQNFAVYGAVGNEAGFSLDPTVAGGSPTSFGYTLIGTVDTSDLGIGGQHGSSIQLTGGGTLGDFRYILYDIFPADLSAAEPATTNTFFSELDVVGSTAAIPEPSTYALMLGGVLLLLVINRYRRLSPSDRA